MIEVLSKCKILLLLSLCVYFPSFNSCYAQDGFYFQKGEKKDAFSFQLIHNLVIIPVEVNGTPLSFLLDTGVKNTILFALSETDSIVVKNVAPIKIRGLGTGGSVDAFKSGGNSLRIGKTIDNNHSILLVFEESLNLSPRMGLPIHGIIGYEFFKQFVVKTNYSSKRLTIYDPDHFEPRKCRKCETFDLVFYNDKPHVDVEVESYGQQEKVTLLIDSGSSDALWLFDEDLIIREDPKNYFDDFLGLGLSGNIFGKRTRLDEIHIGTFTVKDVNVASPEPEALGNSLMFDKRNGSLGGDLLKRFTVTMNYQKGIMTLRKNAKFKDPFYYNMSGLVLEHDGLEVVRSNKKVVNNPFTFGEGDVNKFAQSIIGRTNFKFELLPKIVVVEIRKDSPADLAGIQKGDELLFVNGKPAHSYELYELNALFTSKVGKRIAMEILRNGQTLKKKFVLKALIQKNR